MGRSFRSRWNDGTVFLLSDSTIGRWNLGGGVRSSRALTGGSSRRNRWRRTRRRKKRNIIRNGTARSRTYKIMHATFFLKKVCARSNTHATNPIFRSFSLG